MLGFQTQQHCNNFIDSVDVFMESRIDREAQAVIQRRRKTVVRPYPISIEWPVHWLNGVPPAAECRATVRSELGLAGDALLGVGVDRLDYTKGIPARLRAIDALFERHPEHRRRVSFVQVAVRSRSRVREYREIKRRIDELVGRINGRHGDAEWQPIRYANEGLERAELVAHYLAADVCLVTPLRDGMNLVALEFCACRPRGDGVLVLSEFAGAAERLGSAALVVNPYAIHEVADALDEALAMPPEQQARWMRSARRQVLEHDVRRWLDSVLAAAAQGVETWAA
jgi:trehalose 6-phosphate synthase